MFWVSLSFACFTLANAGLDVLQQLYYAYLCDCFLTFKSLWTNLLNHMEKDESEPHNVRKTSFMHTCIESERRPEPQSLEFIPHVY